MIKQLWSVASVLLGWFLIAVASFFFWVGLYHTTLFLMGALQ